VASLNRKKSSENKFWIDPILTQRCLFTLTGVNVYTLEAIDTETNSGANVIYGFNNKQQGDTSIDTKSTFFRIDSVTGEVFTDGNKLDYEV